MKKNDLRVQYKDFYRASAKAPEVVTIPSLSYLMVEGSGEPNGPEFQDAIGSLYGVAYTLKTMLRDARPSREIPVMPLEGLWWSDGTDSFDWERKESWRWRLLILQPDVVTRAMVKQALTELAGRRGRTPALGRIALRRMREGRAVQMLHVGPWSAEAPTLERMKEFIRANGLRVAGKHHEIYLSDPRRTVPGKLRTILRLPVKRAVLATAARA